MSSKTEIGIVEMGANHLKEIAFLSEITQPNYGLITNLKAYLEGFGSEEGGTRQIRIIPIFNKNNQQIFVNNKDHKQVNLNPRIMPILLHMVKIVI